MDIYYFFGELGYVHQVILAYTQRYVKNHPEKKGNIKLITYNGNEYFFESLFPGFFSFFLVPLHDCRSGFHGHVDLFFPGIPHISKMFDKQLPASINQIPWGQDLREYYIEGPIPMPIYPELDELCKGFNYIVVAFYRNRQHEQLRNYDNSNTAWNNELAQHASNQDTLFCVFNASKEESIVPSYVDTNAKNIRLIKTIQEASYWFHTCDIAYMNDSGLCDFAKNCAIRRMKIIPSISQNVVYNPSIYFNPFNTQIEIFGEYTLHDPVTVKQ